MKKGKNKLVVILCSILVIALLAGFTIGGFVHIAPEKVMRKVDAIENSGVYSAADVSLLDKHLLPHTSDLKKEIWYASELLTDIQPNINATYAGGEIGYYWRFVKNQIGHYPTGNVRKMEGQDGSYYYSVYQLDNGGRLFVFSRDGFVYGFPVYMEKTLDSQAFSQIRIGDSIDRVAAVDPMVYTVQKAFLSSALNQTDIDLQIKECESTDLYYPYTSVHLLTDGLLLIEYDVRKQDDRIAFTVKTITNSKDFLMPDFRPYYTEKYSPALWAEEKEQYTEGLFSMQILEQDYVGDVVLVADGEIPPEEPQALAKDAQWSIQLINQSSNTVTASVFDKEAAEKLTIRKAVTSRYEKNNPKYAINTIIAQGVSATDFLTAIGAKDVRSLVIKDANGKEHIIDADKLQDCLLAWIENKQYAIKDSATQVAIVFNEGMPDSYISSVVSITLQ